MKLSIYTDEKLARIKSLILMGNLREIIIPEDDKLTRNDHAY